MEKDNKGIWIEEIIRPVRHEGIDSIDKRKGEVVFERYVSFRPEFVIYPVRDALKSGVVTHVNLEKFFYGSTEQSFRVDIGGSRYGSIAVLCPPKLDIDDPSSPVWWGSSPSIALSRLTRWREFEGSSLPLDHIFNINS